MSSYDNPERRPLLSQQRHPSYETNQRGNDTVHDDTALQQVEAQSDNDGAGEEEEELSTGQLVRIMSGVYLAATLSSLDGTLIATLVTPISNSLNSGTLFAWLASAYFIANAASQPLAGKLSDIYGRKTGMVLSNILFGIGNLLCGLAQSERSMIAGRIIAGLGGGGIGPIATSLASDLIPLHRRGLWQGFSNICYGIGSSLGGPAGGLIHDAIGWRWAFLLQVPFTVVTVIIVLLFQDSPSHVKTITVDSNMPDDGQARWKRVDFLGATCLVSSLVLLLAGLNAAGNIVPWSHPLVLSTLPISALLLILFIVVEIRVAQEPIIPMSLLTQRTILSSCFANWFISAARFALFFYVPVFFYLQGLSATATGLRLIPESIAIGTTSVLFGFVMRSTGSYYWLGIASGVATCIGMGLIMALNTTTPIWLPFVCFILVGFGFSGMLSLTIIAMVASAEHKYQAVITSTSYAFRSTGTTLGISIASVIFQAQLSAGLRERLGHLPGSEELIRKLRNNLGEIDALPKAWHDAAILSYMDALHAVFVFLLVTSILGLLSLSLVREHKLHKKVSRRD